MRLFIVLILLILPATSTASTALEGTCDVQFFGSSTLHDFEGKGTCKPFSVDIDDGTLTGVRLEVPVSRMDTDNDSRDEKMREMFEAESYPQIIGTLQPARTEALRKQLHLAEADNGTFPLNLRIRQTERQVKARVTQLIDSPKALSIDLEFILSLKDYQLEPPSVLFISVDDEIRVQVQLHLAPLPTPWQP